MQRITVRASGGERKESDADVIGDDWTGTSSWFVGQQPGMSQGTGFGSTPGLRVGSKIFRAGGSNPGTTDGS